MPSQSDSRLELCGAHLLAQLLDHVKEVFKLPLDRVYAWTDSTIIVINWLVGDHRRFKTYVGNRVSQIVDLIALECWHHVSGVESPADCASRGLLPSELLGHKLWWNGPDWLCLGASEWPGQSGTVPLNSPSEEEAEICCHATAVLAKEPGHLFSRSQLQLNLHEESHCLGTAIYPQILSCMEEEPGTNPISIDCSGSPHG